MNYDSAIKWVSAWRSKEMLIATVAIPLLFVGNTCARQETLAAHQDEDLVRQVQS